MINFIFGAVGALVVICLIGIGAVIGWQANNAFRRHSTRVAAEEASEEERRQLIADQRAFETMLNYNQDIAYGTVATVSEMEGDVE